MIDVKKLPVLDDRGRPVWTSLDELADTEEFKTFLHREFPENAAELLEPVSRRSFLSVMGASVALAGFGPGCIRKQEEHILPYARRPEDLVPGLPQRYATTMSLAGSVTGLVVEAHEGRPTKVEGNPLHPASSGGACTFEQAAILSLYDPDRQVQPTRSGAPGDWPAFDAFAAQQLGALRASGGQGLFVLHEAYSSPTFDRVRAGFQQAFPNAQVLEWEAVSDDEALAGTRLAFGQPLQPVYQLENADTLLVCDADLFSQGPFHLRYARDWARRRNPDNPMNRMYVVEPVFSTTGAVADHRLRLRGEEVGPFLRALAAKLAELGVPVAEGVGAAGGKLPEKWLNALAKDLAGRKDRTAVIVGRRQPAAVHAVAHAINAALGNLGHAVRFAAVAHAPAVPHRTAIQRLAQALSAGQVDTLVVLGGNPAYDAPAELQLASLLPKAKNRIHLAEAPNETTALCEWALPGTHFLEAWGDATTADGTLSIQQPLIQPIWNGRSPIELLNGLTGTVVAGLELVKATFTARGSDEAVWRKALHDGVVPGSTPAPVTPALDAAAAAQAAGEVAAAGEVSWQALELAFIVDAKVFDGRFANNGWLQELPDAMTKLTWTNAALVSPTTAHDRGLHTNEICRIELGGRAVEAPVLIFPGMADGVVAIALGYGRTKAGRVGDGQGTDVYPLRTSAAMEFAKGAKVSGTGQWVRLASTQDHHRMEGRPLIRVGTVDQYRSDRSFAQKMEHVPERLSMWPDHAYPGQQWGMAIDLNVCLGCNGCMVACQAENNIPVVGPLQVAKGREMHWIRLDRYFVGDEHEPEALHQPMLCQHCENAPCETVCPVNATVHNPDGGTNDMVYNRCIGTRYCSNNCPWKVRRFNFLNWHEREPGRIEDVEKLKFNPDVTVRTRGVMEKCTFCIQRVHAARREVKLDAAARGTPEKIPDGAVVPACGQACPTQAIVFGDVNDERSRVSRLKAGPRSYLTLAELNTRPRVSYLAKIRNPNKELT